MSTIPGYMVVIFKWWQKPWKFDGKGMELHLWLKHWLFTSSTPYIALVGPHFALNWKWPDEGGYLANAKYLKDVSDFNLIMWLI